MTLSRRSLTFSLLGLAALPRAVRATALPTPTDRVILTVSGRISVTNADAAARFDRPMLEALGTYGFTTRTPWYDGPMRFEGVRMATLLQAVGATGDTIVATALNDYETRIPISDFTTLPVVLALKRNGHYMEVADKGPLFIVYNFDSDTNLQTRQYYGRCVWQLARMTVS
jgi:hypothetical protein